MTFKDTLLTSENYIKTTTDLDNNLLGKVLLPSIKLAQDIELREAIGEKLLQSLQQKVFDKSINDSGNTTYKEFLDEYVQPFLAYQTLANAAMLAANKVMNAGVVQTNDTNVNNINEANKNLLKENYLHFARHYLKLMQDYLKQNCNSFEELECGCGPGKPHLDDATGIPIWTGGTRAKKGYNRYRVVK